ncbi:hypothetical protein VNI00_017160 [Paramarasmius palmivorus]|uniref:RNI-like protein n=1 Tax=Paramarasmius palmivorus TaxID=297713 RepID=A0AAW0B9R4_9AGAR
MTSKPTAVVSHRGHIDCVDCGLRSISGAQEIITKITARKVVTKLALNHNELSDDGCIVLFAFLSSAVGKKYRIAEIGLSSNNIGDRGLEAITSYLAGNIHMKELYLQNNNFTANPASALALAQAINTSKLQFLSLAANHSLSDTFTQAFIAALNCPTLKELHLSAIDITSSSAACISDFVSSSRCQLDTLKLNGNRLGTKGAQEIVEAVERKNFNLLDLELHETTANGQDNGGHIPSYGDERADSKDWEASLARIMSRNRQLQRSTEAEALELLVCARAVLLRSGKSTQTPANSSPFTSLPKAIHFRILSHLAPTLSPRQRLDIFNYASSSTTLGRVLPCIPGSNASESKVCIPDPTTSMMGPDELTSSGMDPNVKAKTPIWAFTNGPGVGCPSGKCMGAANSVLCHRMQERTRWLELVQCTAYDPRGSTEAI